MRRTEELQATERHGVMEYASRQPRRRRWWVPCIVVPALGLLQVAIVLSVEFCLANESEAGIRHPIIEIVYYVLAAPVYWMLRLIRNPSMDQALALLVANGVFWGVGSYFLIHVMLRRQQMPIRSEGTV